MTLLPTAFESKAHVFRLIFFLTGSRWFQFVSVDILKSNWKNFRLVRGNHHTEHFRSFKMLKMLKNVCKNLNMWPMLLFGWNAITKDLRVGSKNCILLTASLVPFTQPVKGENVALLLHCSINTCVKGVSMGQLWIVSITSYVWNKQLGANLEKKNSTRKCKQRGPEAPYPPTRSTVI